MNDPHVEFLIYELKTSDTIDFANPPPLAHETEGLSLRLESGRLTVTMKEHHGSVESARREVDPFLRAWELDVALRYRRQEITFEYVAARVIDRKPPSPGAPQVIALAGIVSLEMFGTARLTVAHRNYPPPPVGFLVSPDVETLWRRYEGYLNGREPISSMANFCLTLAEYRGGSRKGAAMFLGVEFAVLSKLGELASTKGDELTARKVPTAGFTPYTVLEVRWMEAATRVIIRRFGERQAGAALYPKTTMLDLPPLNPQRDA